MRKENIVLLLVLIIMSCSTGTERKQTENTGARISTKVMTGRIREAAVKYADRTINRYCEYDLAMGRTQQELIDMNSMGIMFLTAVSRDPEELPLKRVYFRSDSGDEIVFPVIFSKRVAVNDETIKKTFGTTRMDYYFVVPCMLLYLKGEFLVDWKNGRTGFKIADMPNPYAFGFQLKDSDLVPRSEKLNTGLFMKFLVEEYDIMESEKSSFSASIDKIR